VIKVTTKSGSVYHLHMDTKNWQRFRSEGTTLLPYDNGTFESIQVITNEGLIDADPTVGKMMLILGNAAHADSSVEEDMWIRTTPVVSVEEVE
jgi:hypothetical protein